MFGLQGGADFVPADFSGCRLWVRSDLGISLVTGSKVQAWQDQITKTNYVQTTDANRPVYSPGLQGRPKLVFSGSQALFNSNFFLTGPMSVFIVIQLTSTPTLGNSVVPYVIQGAAGSALRSLLIFINVGGYQPITFKHDLSASGAAVGSSNYTTAARCYVLTYNGGTNTTAGNYTLEDLGTGLSVSATSSIGSAAAFFSSIGAAVNDPAGTISAGSEMSADFYEFSLYDRPLSIRERLDLYAYANRLYGIHS